jgi:hypothetical protein
MLALQDLCTPFAGFGRDADLSAGAAGYGDSHLAIREGYVLEFLQQRLRSQPAARENSRQPRRTRIRRSLLGIPAPEVGQCEYGQR